MDKVKIKALQTDIQELELWLQEHPDAQYEAQHQVRENRMNKLKELNEILNKKEDHETNNQSTEAN